ncbi:MAG TPA: S8 family serine peptidase [Gemmatimonadales bacterium]|nr:S8 family serine peptidase [Gemmatimonadales bacterium]
MSLVRSVPRLATLAVVGTAACVYDARVPSEPAVARAPQLSAMAIAGASSAAVVATGRHIVAFSGSVPANFAAQVAALGGKVLWVSSGSGLAVVSGLKGNAPATLAGNRGIQEVDADAAIPLDIPLIATESAADGGGGASNANPAGAVRFARQWNMLAVRADAAWAHGFLGSSSVSVFMLDSGIDYLHADLVGRVDLNRSVDLTGTFLTQVVVGNDTLIVPFTEADTVAKYFPGRFAFTDLFFHGTHTGATVSSNAVRAAGITSGTTLVSVKVCGFINECPFSSILNGIVYAALNGADVVNMSLGGAFTKAGNGRFAALLNKTFNFARSRGVTVVVSAGNSAADLDHDGNTYSTFCNTPSVICVAATGPLSDANATNPDGNLARTGPFTSVDAPSYFTNFGRSAINVAAPGGNSSFGPRLTAPAGRDVFVWAACSQTSLLIGCFSSPLFIVGAQGTSMSAPHVSGTAALLVSILGRNPSQIKARIQQSADNVAGNGTTLFYGKGRLNVARAVGAIP